VAYRLLIDVLPFNVVVVKYSGNTTHYSHWAIHKSDSRRVYYISEYIILKYIRVCYNEQFLSIKSRCYNGRVGILSADVARACVWSVGPSRFD